MGPRLHIVNAAPAGLEECMLERAGGDLRDTKRGSQRKQLSRRLPKAFAWKPLTSTTATGRETSNMLVSVVIPVCNEAENLVVLLGELATALNRENWEIIFINDGSQDGSGEVLYNAALADRRVKVLNFSRNFGHQAAITAG